ncbi:hypothetical protein M8C21_014068 [Ambrosia artemisiifolia]|uniref:Uncharacterized protein n=1 Tax=Ambrosia artemisiifolia TaxID=4212 RepID=A0AAD5CYR0_AMBAR|nr:hypothetical protein M8C21_014068 [Ambrosia artemisiifolia]
MRTGHHSGKVWWLHRLPNPQAKEHSGDKHRYQRKWRTNVSGSDMILLADMQDIRDSYDSLLCLCSLISDGLSFHGGRWCRGADKFSGI